MDPAELKLIIDRSQEIFIARSNPKKRSTEEEAVYKFARASIVADRNLKRGHTITSHDIWARRPGNGPIPADQFDSLVGKKINKNISKNTQLNWDDFV